MECKLVVKVEYLVTFSLTLRKGMRDIHKIVGIRQRQLPVAFSIAPRRYIDAIPFFIGILKQLI